MTEPELTDSTWQQQFYLEMEKAQMLRTIGLTNHARHVLAHVDDCGLSTHHQEMLNKWLKMVEQEVSIRQQYVQFDVPLDQLNYAVDTTYYEVPGANVPETYAFGTWILSADDFEFMSCANAFEFKTKIQSNASVITVYPNPGRDDFFLMYAGEPTVAKIELRNSLGEILGAKESPLEPFSVNALDMVPAVPGVYYVVVSTATGRWSERVVVVN